MPKKGRVAEPGLAGTAPGMGAIMMAPVSVCHQVSTTGQRLWPIFSRYHIHASGFIGSPTVPRSRSDRRSWFSTSWSPHHESANGGGGGVEDGDLVVVDDFPKTGEVGPVGGAFVHEHGCSVLKRTVEDVGVAGDPADVGRAPVDVFVADVEDVLGGEVGLHGIAARGVDEALGLAGGAGGVEVVEGVL